jgi:hypothetical protein
VTHRDLHLIPDNNQQGETLREFSFTKMVRFPSGLWTIPSWRAVSDIFDNVA